MLWKRYRAIRLHVSVYTNIYRTLVRPPLLPPPLLPPPPSFKRKCPPTSPTASAKEKMAFLILCMWIKKRKRKMCFFYISLSLHRIDSNTLCTAHLFARFYFNRIRKKEKKNISKGKRWKIEKKWNRNKRNSHKNCLVPFSCIFSKGKSLDLALYWFSCTIGRATPSSYFKILFSRCRWKSADAVSFPVQFIHSHSYQQNRSYYLCINGSCLYIFVCYAMLSTRIQSHIPSLSTQNGR